MTWFAQNAPAISTDIQNVLALVQAVGLANSPGVATAIQDANLSLSQPSICLLPCAEVSQRALVSDSTRHTRIPVMEGADVSSSQPVRP
jgi:hypothetical protein